MIKNEKQYKITRKALQGWQSTHEQLLHYRKPGTPKWVHDAQIASAKVQICQLQAQLKEYESLRAGKGKLKDISIVNDISDLLLKWRIRNNLTHRELANLVDMKEQQIQRYEETNYQSASLSTIMRVAHALQFYKHQGHRTAASR